MAYWKFNKPEQLAAWDKLRADDKQMRREGAVLAGKFNASPVFSNELTRSSFYGVKFDEGFYVAKELWTKPTSNSGFACWPKMRTPKGLSEEHKSLMDIWKTYYPKPKVDNDEFYKAIGLDWGMLFLCGISFFRNGDDIYVETRAIPKEEAGAVEIIGSAFDAAKRDHLNGN